MNTVAASKCRACAAPIETDALKCGRCGALQQGDVVCPHCHAAADASPHTELRFACDVCGAPRVPGATAVGAEGALHSAEEARRSRAMWRAAAGVSGIFAPFFLALTLFATLVIHSLGLGVVLGAFAFLGIAACVGALRRARARSREIGPAIDAAWLATATHLAKRSGGALTAADLAGALRITESQAEELLALVSVDDFVRSEAQGRPRIAVAEAQGAAGHTEIIGEPAEALLEAQIEATHASEQARRIS